MNRTKTIIITDKVKLDAIRKSAAENAEIKKRAQAKVAGNSRHMEMKQAMGLVENASLLKPGPATVIPMNRPATGGFAGSSARKPVVAGSCGGVLGGQVAQRTVAVAPIDVAPIDVAPIDVAPVAPSQVADAPVAPAEQLYFYAEPFVADTMWKECHPHWFGPWGEGTRTGAVIYKKSGRHVSLMIPEISKGDISTEGPIETIENFLPEAVRPFNDVSKSTIVTCGDETVQGNIVVKACGKVQIFMSYMKAFTDEQDSCSHPHPCLVQYSNDPVEEQKPGQEQEQEQEPAEKKTTTTEFPETENKELKTTETSDDDF